MRFYDARTARTGRDYELKKKLAGGKTKISGGSLLMKLDEYIDLLACGAIGDGELYAIKVPIKTDLP